ncbi:NACHT domain-containing protein [Micromonospora gifhornensis]|uniref:NACHT domain-containing protein n=1 Tax=Micromonospora gifhornensis TaxID=84594 RepID=UPI003649275E
MAPLLTEPELFKEASNWASEIDSAIHLRALSDLPLFLLLLLRTREQLTEFPEDLYAVLAEAITRLVGEHRRRKIDVAVAADAFPSTGDVRKVSAATAEHMHLSSMLSIADDDLRELFRRTLADSIGYPAAEAHAMASALVNSLSPGVGLMIRPAPDETRFFHRSVLEFLAAERMLARPSTEQIALFQEHLTDRRWSQVLRFLIRSLVRPPEIAAIFDALDEASANDSLLREHLNLLAADLVVTAGQADAPTRRRLLDRVIREVETGERTPHRAHLIDRLVVGLARPEIRGELLKRFEDWLRAMPWEMWTSVLDAASSWEPDDLLLDMLWHAILSDSDQVHRVAGRVLGTRFAGISEVADRLAELANTTRLPHRRAAATEALSIGWPQHHALDSLITTGRNNIDFAVRHTAIAADLRRGKVTDTNRSTLIELLDHAPTITAWSDGLMELMFTHYPDDQVIFEHYLPQADPTTTDQIRYGQVPAMYLILKGYTTRPEAKEFFLKFIAADRRDFPGTPSNLTDRVPWKEISEVYRTDDDVVAAVERLVDEYGPNSFHNRDIYFCSQVARTRKLRNKLIASVQSQESYGIGWAIRALLEGWSDDPEVQDTLSRLMSVTGGAVPDGAIWYLPDIVTDPETALSLLASIAPIADHQGAVVHALHEIIERARLRADPRTTVILDRALAHEMTDSWTSPEVALYVYFPDYPGVRELALARIDDRDTPLHKIAYGFRVDQQIRQAVAARLKPLTAPLRGRLVEGLTDASPTDTGATLLLGRYDIEPDPTVKLLAATAYVGRLAATNAVTDEVIDTITEQARATGHDHYERRAAAFAALARLDRLDKLTDLRERFGDHGPVRVHHSYLSDTSLFYRIICRHWEDVKTALGNDLPRRFGFDNTSEFWQNILAVAYDYPRTHADLTTLLEQQPTLAASAAGVTYLSRIEPRSNRLWQSTTSLLRKTRGIAYADIQPAWPALSILEDQFADDSRTSAWLDAEFAPITQAETAHHGRIRVLFPSFGTVAAIARLHSSHPAVQELLTQAQRMEGQPWHAFHEWTELAAATTPDAQGFVDLAVEISRIVRINDMFPEYIHRPLTARLRRDASLATAVADLAPALSGAAFGIAVRLLSLSARLGGPLVSHLRSRLSTPNDQDPDTFDPLVGQARHSELLIRQPPFGIMAGVRC